MKKFIKELVDRAKAETPSFFKKIRVFSICIATLCVGIVVAYKYLPTEFTSFLPSYFYKVVTVATLVSAGICTLTRTYKSDNENDIPKVDELTDVSK